MKLNIIIILLILTGCKQKNNSLALFSDVIPNQYEKNVHDMDIASSQAIDIDVDKNPLVDAYSGRYPFTDSGDIRSLRL